MEGVKRIRPTAADEVVDHVKALVFDGVLVTGDRLDLPAIADDLGVSATPIREAIAALGREGTLVVHPRRGAFAARFDATTVSQHFSLCGVVFGFAARQAAVILDQRTPAELRRHAGAVLAAADPDDLRTTIMSGYAIINRAADGPTLRSVLRALDRIVPGNIFATVPTTQPIARQYFPALVEAVIVGDGEEADRISRTMWDAYGEVIVKHQIDRGVFADATEVVRPKNAAEAVA